MWPNPQENADLVTFTEENFILYALESGDDTQVTERKLK